MHDPHRAGLAETLQRFREEEELALARGDEYGSRVARLLHVAHLAYFHVHARLTMAQRREIRFWAAIAILALAQVAQCVRGQTIPH